MRLKASGKNERAEVAIQNKSKKCRPPFVLILLFSIYSPPPNLKFLKISKRFQLYL